MWPWGHLAVGYLLSVLSLRVRRKAVDGTTVVLLAVGTQFPDLIDKPLTWVGVLPGGRSLAHSLLVVIPLSAGVVYVAREADLTGWRSGFVLGYLSHLGADSYRAVLTGRFGELTFLAWPLLSLPDYERNSPWDHLDALVGAFRDTDASLFLARPMGAFTGQLVLFVAVCLLWVSQGTPGLARLRESVRRRVRRIQS